VAAGLLFFVDLCLGAVSIPLKDVWNSLTGHEITPVTHYIVTQYRLPKAVTALLSGIGLSVSGLLMQTLFRNPLAGPYVLGLSSGSGLGVAVLVMGAGIFPGIAIFASSAYGVVVASLAGSLSVFFAVIAVSRRLRDTASILIVGLMFGSFSGALVGALSYFGTAEQLQKFTFWSLGNLGNLPWPSVGMLGVSVLSGLLLAIACIKPLNALLLGERYAESLGVPFARIRLLVIAATCLLTGSVTAFAGPIAFVGLAIPHMARLLFRTSRHEILFFATLLAGSAIMLGCDILCQLPGSEIVLPINVVTSVIGAPVVIWLLLRQRKIAL
jgi:iron complex transport system permease protein